MIHNLDTSKSGIAMQIAMIANDAVSGDEVYVFTEAQKELAERALARLKKNGVVVRVQSEVQS